MGTSNPSWVLMAKTTTIRSSNPFSKCMYVRSLTCDFGIFGDKMVVPLTILNISDI